MNRSVTHVSAIIACMYAESGLPRMRITEKTFCVIGKRERLHGSHKTAVADELADSYGLAFIECNRGFVVFPISSLDGTKSRTFKAFREATETDWKDEDAVRRNARKLIDPTADGEDDNDDE
jgi:hypothetical protein